MVHWKQSRSILETHERELGALIGLLAVASLCIGAGEAHAQSVFFVRLAPEVGLRIVFPMAPGTNSTLRWPIGFSINHGSLETESKHLGNSRA